MREGITFFIAACAYAVLGRVALELATSVLPEATAAAVVGFVWLLGFIWLVGAWVGGPRGGNTLLRFWIGLYGGIAIALFPVAFFPHPAVLVLGAVLGFGFGTWVAFGKAEWPL